MPISSPLFSAGVGGGWQISKQAEYTTLSLPSTCDHERDGQEKRSIGGYYLELDNLMFIPLGCKLLSGIQGNVHSDHRLHSISMPHWAAIRT